MKETQALEASASYQDRAGGGLFRVAPAIVSYLILAIGLITIAVAVRMVRTCYISLPGSDQWSQIDAAMAGVDLSDPRWLWAQHNEHRLVFTKLLSFIDIRFFHGRQIFLLCCIFLVQMVELLLLAWCMRRFGHLRGAVWRTGVGLMSFCLFCPSQWENLIWGFQVQCGMPMLFATLSIAALLLFAEKQGSATISSWRYIVLCIAAAVASTFSLANGILVWPLLIAAAVLLSLRGTVVALLAAAGVLNIGAYFYGFFWPQQHAQPLASLATPIRVLSYTATLLGSSWIDSGIGIAVIIGGIGITVAMTAVGLLWARGKLTSPFYLLLVFLLLFTLATIGVTALGRMNFGLEQAFSSRYQTVALVFWGALAVLLVTWTAELEHSPIPLLIVQIGILCAVTWAATHSRFALRTARWYAFQMNAAGAAMLTGAKDDVQFQRAAVNPELALAEAAFMQKEGLSIFAGEQYSRLGKRFNSLFPGASPHDCRGAVESITAVDPSGTSRLRLKGWVWDATLRTEPSEIIVVVDDTIQGVGVVGDWRPDVKANQPGVRSNNIGFTAYVRMPGHEPGTVYAISRGTSPKVCRLGSISAPD